MHHLALFEIDRSYHRVTGEWVAQDDFRSHGYTKDRHKDTLRVIAPNEGLARAFVEAYNKHSFTSEAKMTIDAIRELSLDGMVSVTF